MQTKSLELAVQTPLSIHFRQLWQSLHDELGNMFCKYQPHVMRVLSVTAVVLLLPNLAVWAGCCAHCGCQSNCRKVCRLVCEEKSVDVVCYGIKCEEFCVPGPGCEKCQHCESVCPDCNKAGEPKSGPRPFLWSTWIPSDAKMFTKNKLMKQTVTKKVPTYKWVVEDLCAECRQGKSDDAKDKTKTAELPDVPQPEGLDDVLR